MMVETDLAKNEVKSFLEHALSKLESELSEKGVEVVDVAYVMGFNRLIKLAKKEGIDVRAYQEKLAEIVDKYETSKIV